MAEQAKHEPIVEVADTNLEPRDIPLNEPLPATNDPGGARAKGHTAEARPETNVKPSGPVPLAAVPEDKSQVRQAEREGKVRPTGRSEPGAYTPNERLMGSDR